MGCFGSYVYIWVINNCGVCSPRYSKYVTRAFLDTKLPVSKPGIGEGGGSYAARHMFKTAARLTYTIVSTKQQYERYSAEK